MEIYFWGTGIYTCINVHMWSEHAWKRSQCSREEPLTRQGRNGTLTLSFGDVVEYHEHRPASRSFTYVSWKTSRFIQRMSCSSLWKDNYAFGISDSSDIFVAFIAYATWKRVADSTILIARERVSVRRNRRMFRD